MIKKNKYPEITSYTPRSSLHYFGIYYFSWISMCVLMTFSALSSLDGQDAVRRGCWRFGLRRGRVPDAGVWDRRRANPVLWPRLREVLRWQVRGQWAWESVNVNLGIIPVKRQKMVSLETVPMFLRKLERRFICNNGRARKIIHKMAFWIQHKNSTV